MKKSIVIASLTYLLSVPAAFAITVGDLKTILNDEKITAHLEESNLVQIESLGQGIVASCGPNSLVQQKIIFLKRGDWTRHALTFTIEASDGNCMSQAARVAKLIEEKPLVEAEVE